MTFSKKQAAGFSLLEMLVVIGISALFMGLVITLPLQVIRHAESPTEMLIRFNEWLGWQKSNALFSPWPLRMCVDKHQIIMQQFVTGKWQRAEAVFTVSVSITLQGFYTENAPPDDSAFPCFLISANGLDPAGGIKFGLLSTTTSQWSIYDYPARSVK